MNFKLVQITPRKRVYESDVEIVAVPRPDFNYTDELENARALLREGVKILNNCFRYVVISDASTHTERLVFAGALYERDNGDKIYDILSHQHIDGALTMMIYGGDESSVHPDEVYLRRIRMANIERD